MVIAVATLNRMLELGRPEYVRFAQQSLQLGLLRPRADPCNTVAQGQADSHR
jgi:hypothetical protein